MLKKCPKCSEENPDDAFLCSCGYEFRGDETLLPSPPSRPLALSRGMLVWLTSACLTAGAATFVIRRLRPDLQTFAQRPVEFVILAVTFFALTAVLFFTLIFCGRVLISPHIGWIAKILWILLIALCAWAVGSGVVFAGCTALLLPNRL